MENLTDVYNELIMEHSMNSYNKKKLENADYSEIGHNPNCGDEITLELKLKGDVMEDMSCVSKEKMQELNIELGKIMRIMGLNSWWVKEYGDVSFDDKPCENLYQKIYDEHIENSKEFLFEFINVTNKLFNK